MSDAPIPRPPRRSRLSQEQLLFIAARGRDPQRVAEHQIRSDYRDLLAEIARMENVIGRLKATPTKEPQVVTAGEGWRIRYRKNGKSRKSGSFSTPEAAQEYIDRFMKGKS